MYIDHLKEHVHPLTMNCKALIERINPSVSTYAPAGGATKPITPFQTYDRVSIHAPAGGATQNRINDLDNKRFQSTRLREARR